MFKVGDVIQFNNDDAAYQIVNKRLNGGMLPHYITDLKLIKGEGVDMKSYRWTSLKYHAKRVKGIVNTLYSERL